MKRELTVTAAGSAAGRQVLRLEGPTAGQTFYEGPDDVHIVGRNARQTKPAKFVVFFVKDKGAPILVPAQ